jgi:hypothetical protein
LHSPTTPSPQCSTLASRTNTTHCCHHLHSLLSCTTGRQPAFTSSPYFKAVTTPLSAVISCVLCGLVPQGAYQTSARAVKLALLNNPFTSLDRCNHIQITACSAAVHCRVPTVLQPGRSAWHSPAAPTARQPADAAPSTAFDNTLLAVMSSTAAAAAVCPAGCQPAFSQGGQPGSHQQPLLQGSQQIQHQLPAVCTGTACM